MNSRRVRGWVLVAIFCAASAAVVALSPPASAAGSLYQAGIQRLGGVICRCPVQTGDCVCEIIPK